MRSTLSIFALVIFALIFSVPETANADWPQFLGPNRNGQIEAREWSSDWSKDVTALWRKELGTGYASFAVVDGKVYTMGYVDGKDVVYCFDAISGKEQWTFSYECPLVNNLHKGGPGSTPTIHEGKVYTLSRDGDFHCLSAEKGEKIWAKNITEITGVKRPEWGFTSAPLILGDKVIVDAGALLALNKTNGDTIWQSEKQRPGYGSAVVMKVADETYLAHLGNEYLQITKASDGKTVVREQWKTSFATNSATPTIRGDMLFLSTGYQRGCALWKFTGTELENQWETKGISSHMANCVFVGDHLFGIDGNSHASSQCKLVCVNVSTGKRVWAERGFGCGSVVLADDMLLVQAEDGRVVCVKPNSESYEPISVSPAVKSKCWTPPAIDGRRIYCRNDAGSMVCLELPKRVE